eukprot:364034-Chlamydomonas_euryale.AAC.3
MKQATADGVNCLEPSAQLAPTQGYGRLREGGRIEAKSVIGTCSAQRSRALGTLELFHRQIDMTPAGLVASFLSFVGWGTDPI